MRLAFLIFLFLFPAVAHAQDNAALCAFRAAHKAPSAAYQPGVDVHGNPVVPADLNAPLPGYVPDKINIPVTIDMAQQLHMPLPSGTKLEADAGMIEIYMTGKVMYNGQDITEQTQALCAGQPVPDAKKEPELLASPKKDEEIIWGEGH